MRIRIRTVLLDAPWRVDRELGVVYLSSDLSPDDAPLHLRDALAELYPRERAKLALVK